MFEQLNYVLTKISLLHLNVLLLLGLALFGGTIGGRIFQKLRIPQVVGYIIIGIIIGQSGLKMVDENIINILQPFNYFALGLIGFMVGCELRKDIFIRYGKQLISILLCEGIAPFLLVTLLVGSIGTLFFGDWRLAWSLALLLGAIASATDPATTTEVFREYRTRGPLTTTVLGIVALDDGLAFLLFAIASSIAGSLSGNIHSGVLKTFIHPVYEIVGAVLIGYVFGITLSKILKKYSEAGRLLAFSIGTVLLVIGLSLALHVEMLLAAMTLGVVIVNYIPKKSEEVFKLVAGFAPPIYVLFFVLIGAKLNLSYMTWVIFLFVGIYIFGTIAGKFVGSQFGTRLMKAPAAVQKYLSFALFSQAGVAIGLSILAAQYFPGPIGNTLIIISTTTTFILQMIGPPFTKLAVTKAGEVGLNITEEDLIRTTRAEEAMDKNPPLIYKEMSLSQILKVFSESPNIYYPVVDHDKRLLGIITVDHIKTTFMEAGLSELLKAVDLMEPVPATAKPEEMVSAVKEILGRYNLEYLPVVDREDKIVGFIERRSLDKLISTRIMELQKQVEF